MKRVKILFSGFRRNYCIDIFMIWIARLCGVLAATYLVYLSAQSSHTAAASAGQPMVVAAPGEMMPAIEAVKYNNLQSYKQRFPLFPAVLEGTRWVHTLDKTNACTSNPQKLWTFSGQESFGKVCTGNASAHEVSYKCEETSILGRKVLRDYTVTFGDTILPDWTLDRPHITLIRDGWHKKTIGLKLCDI